MAWERLVRMGERWGRGRGKKKRAPREALDPSLGARLEMDRRVWNAPPPVAILHPKAPGVMKAPPQACYNFVTPGQRYDKLDGPWTRALVDRARRGTTNVVWAARPACRTAVLCSLSRRAPPAHGSAAPSERIQLLDPGKRVCVCRVVAHADALAGPGMRLPALCRRPAPARLPRRGRGRRGSVSTPP